MTNILQQLSSFVTFLTQPVSFATPTEAIVTASGGVLSLLAAALISRRGLREPALERDWTDKRLQLTGVFGTLLILLAFLRYEGIPYLSMPVVLGVVLLWALISFAQLALYRRSVLKPARTQWREHRAREQYLPQPKRRSTR